METRSVFAPGVRPATAPASATGRSAETQAKAAGFAMRPCFDRVAAIVAPTVPVAPLNVIAARLPGRSVIVCNCEFGSAIIGGEIDSVPVDDPLSGAVMT